MPVNLHADTVSVATTTLGATGARIDRIGLGTSSWGHGLDSEKAREILDAYVESGGSTVEVSDRDGGRAESVLGEALTAADRESIMLVGHSGSAPSGSAHVPGAMGDTSRRALMSALDATLARLGVEHLDLWLVDGPDGLTPASDVAATMEWALTSGRATYVGLSGASAWQAVHLSHELASRGIIMAAHAVEHHLLDRSAENETVPAARTLGYGVIAGSGLAGGVLTGKYRHGTPADSRRASGVIPIRATHASGQARAVVESVATAADGLGVHPSELALAWHLRTETADCVLVGARSVAQARIAVRACGLDVPAEIASVLDEVSARQ